VIRSGQRAAHLLAGRGWPLRRRFTTGQPPPHLDRANTALRPPWPAELHPLPGSRIAEIVIADPAWPSLVAAVAASDWPPRDLLAAAAAWLLTKHATTARTYGKYELTVNDRSPETASSPARPAPAGVFRTSNQSIAATACWSNARRDTLSKIMVATRSFVDRPPTDRVHRAFSVIKRELVPPLSQGELLPLRHQRGRPRHVGLSR
jgi:hypothetical protein